MECLNHFLQLFFSEGGELFQSELQTYYGRTYPANKCPMCWRIIWLKRLNYPLITLIVYLFWGSGRMMFYWRYAKGWSFASDDVLDRTWVWSRIRGAKSCDLFMPGWGWGGRNWGRFAFSKTVRNASSTKSSATSGFELVRERNTESLEQNSEGFCQAEPSYWANSQQGLELGKTQLCTFSEIFSLYLFYISNSCG